MSTGFALQVIAITTAAFILLTTVIALGSFPAIYKQR